MNIEQLEALREGATDAAPGLNVLVIAYYFPPMGLSGVQRTLKFVKYLPQFGWRPIVLTTPETLYYAHDRSLLDEIQPLIDSGAVRIVRTKENGMPVKKSDTGTQKLPSAAWQRLRSKLIQIIYQPDSRIKWKKFAIETAESIFKEERIDAIMSTAPPYTDFLVARELHDKHNVPYLMDYRDAWVANPVLNFYATPFHRAYARKLEDLCLRGSNAITVASRRMKEVLLRQYNYLTHEDVTIVSHGFDTDDIAAARPLVDKYRSPEKFRVTYGGAFYVGRSPLPMFDAVKMAIKREPALGEDIELVFAGILQKEYFRTAEKLGLDGIVRATGYLPHVEDLALLMASDVLWMTMSDTISAPGKLYEYIGTGKPILGLVPERSEADKIISDYGAGISVRPKDTKAISDALIELHRQWKKSQLPRNVNQPFVQTYDRRELTRELARQLGLMLKP